MPCITFLLNCHVCLPETSISRLHKWERKESGSTWWGARNFSFCKLAEEKCVHLTRVVGQIGCLETSWAGDHSIVFFCCYGLQLWMLYYKPLKPYTKSSSTELSKLFCCFISFILSFLCVPYITEVNTHTLFLIWTVTCSCEKLWEGHIRHFTYPYGYD